jgi:hypothetical protein
MCLACSTRLADSYIDPTVTAAHAFLPGGDLTITNADTDDMEELIAKLGFTTTDGGVNSIHIFTDPDGLSGTGSTRDYLLLNGLTDNMLIAHHDDLTYDDVGCLVVLGDGAAVPEPNSLLCLSLAGLGLMSTKRKRNRLAM